MTREIYSHNIYVYKRFISDIEPSSPIQTILNNTRDKTKSIQGNQLTKKSQKMRIPYQDNSLNDMAVFLKMKLKLEERRSNTNNKIERKSQKVLENLQKRH